MDEAELAMLYPTFTLVEGRGIIPNINLPRNFKDLVQKFYAEKRKSIVEEYARDAEEMLRIRGEPLEIRLQWHPEEGLTNISVGTQGGLYLEGGMGMPNFQEHNLGWDNGFVAACVATKYISELLKSA